MWGAGEGTRGTQLSPVRLGNKRGNKCIPVGYCTRTARPLKAEKQPVSHRVPNMVCSEPVSAKDRHRRLPRWLARHGRLTVCTPWGTSFIISSTRSYAPGITSVTARVCHGDYLNGTGQASRIERPVHIRGITAIIRLHRSPSTKVRVLHSVGEIHHNCKESPEREP